MERVRHLLAASAALMTASGLLAACSAGAASGDVLTWYINPDSGGQEKVAENCSTDDYTIAVQVLPQNASEQRIQLSRRLAAEDPEIDIMSIDPPYTAEFANAGFLAAIPEELQAKLKEQSFNGAVDAATMTGPSGGVRAMAQGFRHVVYGPDLHISFAAATLVARRSSIRTRGRYLPSGTMRPASSLPSQVYETRPLASSRSRTSIRTASPSESRTSTVT